MILSILLSIVPTISFAVYLDLQESELYNYKENPKKPKILSTKKQKKRKASSPPSFTALLESEEKIANLLELQSNRLLVKKSSGRVIALSRMHGLLLNSVVAYNTTPTTFIVRIKKGDLEGGELKCLGITYQKRVLSRCNLLVVNDREFSVDVSILDVDGAQGMTVDYLYTGEEKEVLTSSFASLVKSALDTSNLSNSKIKGLSGIGNNLSNKIRQSGRENISISYINAGKPLYVFFNASLEMKR